MERRRSLCLRCRGGVGNAIQLLIQKGCARVVASLTPRLEWGEFRNAAQVVRWLALRYFGVRSIISITKPLQIIKSNYSSF